MKNKNKISKGIIATTLSIATTPAVIISTNNIEAIASDRVKTTDIIRIPDENLANKIRKILNKENDSEITKDDMLSLPTSLDLSNLKISNLNGLQHATQIENLNLSYNNISDISYISGLTNLKTLNLDSNELTNISQLSTIITLENLSLSENEISEISHLSTLTNLKTLNLEFNEITDITHLDSLRGLTELSLYSNKITDISGISNLTNLNSLDLSSNDINTISHLLNLTELNYLNLDSNKITDITVLSSLNKLKYLYVAGNLIDNLDAINSLNELLSLDVGFNQFTDKSTLSNISNLSNLKILYLDVCDVEDLSILTSLSELTTLSLNGNNISNIEPLENLTNLADLDLSSNNIEDISYLSNLVNLEELNLSNNQIFELDVLEDLSALKDLRLDSNKISDISTLSRLNNLEELDLSSNEITNFEPVSNMTSLTALDLSDSNIDNLDFIDSLVNLIDLNLELNSITSIDNLSNLTQIKYLYLGENNISDISPLGNLNSLSSLDLRDNNISNITELSKLHNLRVLDLDNNKVSDISSLTSLVNLENLYIGYNKVCDISPIQTLLNLSLENYYAFNQEISINKKIENRVEIENPFRDLSGYNISNFNTFTQNGEIVSFSDNESKIIIENVNENSTSVLLSFNDYMNNFSGELIVNFSNVYIDLVANTQDWANNSIEISYDVISNGADVSKVTLPDGSTTTNGTGTFRVDSNGTYSFQAELADGLILSQDIIISKIDKIKPELEVSMANLLNGTISYIVNATDNESGIDKIVLPDNTEIFVQPGETTITHSHELSSSAGTYTFIAYDKAGNTMESVLEVSNDSSNPDSNVPPTINASDRTIEKGSNYNALDGVTAFDSDGTAITTIRVVSDNVKINQAGSYSVTYEVTDKNGLTTQKTITITVVEANNSLTPPTINASDRTIEKGSNYNALDGVTAFDSDGTAITTIRVVSDNVKINQAGSYSVTYEVTDKNGLTTQKTITVTVVEKTNTLIPPTINASDRTIQKGSSFKVLDGVTAIDSNGNDITSDIEVIYDDVNEYIPGTYTVTFRVSDSNNASAEKSISVTVVDNSDANLAPIINADNLTIEKGSRFDPLAGVTATDGKGNNITNKVEVAFSSVNTSKTGTYNVTYKVTHNNITTQKTVVITVINSYNIIPNIMTNDLALIVGESFNATYNVTATDKEDGDLTSSIVITENNVNTSKPGSYLVKYSVTDSDGATTTFERSVNVYEKEYKPVLKKKSDIILTTNQAYTILDYIEAEDKTDSDINSRIRLVNHNIDITKAGVYTVECKVTNSLGLTTIETFEVVVKDGGSNGGSSNGSSNNGSSNGDSNSGNSNGGSSEDGSSTSKPQTGDNLLIYSAGVLLSSSAIISVNRKKKEN